SAEHFAAVVLEDAASIFTEAEFQEYGDIASLDVVVHDSLVTDSPTSVPSLASASSALTRSPTSPASDGGGDQQGDENPAGTLATIVICCAIGLFFAVLLASRFRKSRGWRVVRDRNRGIRRLGAKLGDLAGRLPSSCESAACCREVKRTLRSQFGKRVSQNSTHNVVTTQTVVANPMVYSGMKSGEIRNTDVEMSTPLGK
ncbi:hypothetical protein CYMTET_31572, partial [Cymbomonas tetramitiformis]